MSEIETNPDPPHIGGSARQPESRIRHGISNRRVRRHKSLRVPQVHQRVKSMQYAQHAEHYAAQNQQTGARW